MIIPEYSTACPDWADRLKKGQSIIPAPIYPNNAEFALSVFKQLRVGDLPGKPTFGECCEQWVFDFVAAVFGGYDADSGKQLIREYALLISKKNSKSTLAAGIMMTALLLSWRENEEHLIIAPTREVAENSFRPACAMVEADPELKQMLYIRDHIKTIEHRVTHNTLKVVTAETRSVSGKKSGRILVDELWIFGEKAGADAMFMEALGGQISREEGWTIYLTTQSDAPPAGVFKDKLDYWRGVRDGAIEDKQTLPILYEFPKDMIENQEYLKRENFRMTNPNMGRSVSEDWLWGQLQKVRDKQDGTFQQFLAKHLNIEIGQTLANDRWAGADFWTDAAEEGMTLDDIIARSEVIVAGIDGGGLDDLLGLCIIGREKETRRWLHWAHAWAHEIVLKRRRDIAQKVIDFVGDGDMTIVKNPGEDITQICKYIKRVYKLLPQANAIGVDPAGIGQILDALLDDPDMGLKECQVRGVNQGWRLNPYIKTVERMIAGGEMVHCNSPLMRWCVGNAKVVSNGNAVQISKQFAGSAKIDPLMATFDAAAMMMANPGAVKKKSKLVMQVIG